MGCADLKNETLTSLPGLGVPFLPLCSPGHRCQSGNSRASFSLHPSLSTVLPLGKRPPGKPACLMHRCQAVVAQVLLRLQFIRYVLRTLSWTLSPTVPDQTLEPPHGHLRCGGCFWRRWFSFLRSVRAVGGFCVYRLSNSHGAISPGRHACMLQSLRGVAVGRARFCRTLLRRGASQSRRGM